MKTTRNVLILSLLLAFAFIFTACNNNTAPNSSTSPPITSANPESPVKTDTGSPEETETKRIRMTLNGEQVVTAELVDSPATEEFLSLLPFTVTMHEHLDRQKEVYLPFSLSEDNLKNSVTEYEIGDIVYWHPGPTMGIFTDHDGRSISAGVEVLARLDGKGVSAFASYPDEVEVLFEIETGIKQGERQLVITLDDKDVINAALLDTPAANAFAAQLPLTLDMTDYLKREKHAPLNFTIAESDLVNIQKPYEIGDIIYYPPGPTFAMYYDHDGREISAGMEVVARLDAKGIETLATYPDAVKVTVEISDAGSTANGASESGDSNILIAYFTVPETDGVDTVAGASRVVIDGQVLGNHRHIANLVQESTGGDLFEIKTVQEYPGTHDPLLDFANDEKGKNARPELSTTIENLDKYDVIFIGYPNWWADLPMPLYTFLEEYDFNGKTIIPFTVHGGSGFSRTISTITELQPNATVITDGFSISRNSVANAKDDVDSWLKKLGY